MKPSVKLRQLIESEIRSILSEAIAEPSEQILKAVLKELKVKTGIIATPTLTNVRKDYLTYEADLSKEIRTALMRNLFETLTLDITVYEIPNSIGGYSFSVSLNYKHPQGGSNGLDLGTIFYRDGKVTSRFR